MIRAVDREVRRLVSNFKSLIARSFLGRCFGRLLIFSLLFLLSALDFVFPYFHPLVPCTIALAINRWRESLLFETTTYQMIFDLWVGGLGACETALLDEKCRGLQCCQTPCSC